MKFYDMNKCMCEEVCCEFEKFKEDKNIEILKGIKYLLESMVYLNELEAAGAMRRYFEDEHGYDSYTGEFREVMYPRYGIYNALPAPAYTNPNPIYRGDMDGMRRKKDGREYGRGYDYDDDRMGMRDMKSERDMRGIYNMAGMKHKDKLTPQEIHKWMDNLYSDTGEKGPMWSMEEIEAVAKKEGIKFDKFSKEALYAMTNVMYSDHCNTGEKYNVDSPSFYMALAVDFLTDPDAVGGGDDGDKKMAIYYEDIAEH